MMMDQENPILNSPYEKPVYHYATMADGPEKGSLDYSRIVTGRRLFNPEQEGQAIPSRVTGQMTLTEVNDYEREYGQHLINLTRKEISLWRSGGYPGTTRVTKELLQFWFNNPDRHAVRQLFFAQREAVETAIWLNEVAGKTNSGQNILNKLLEGQQTAGNNRELQLPRIAFKMATGTGKTVVMGCLILYHFFNRQEYRQDTRFGDYFLIVTPGITIRDRLGVLFVDRQHTNKYDREDYYALRDLVPRNMEAYMGHLNARLIITNYHSFEPRTLHGNKRSPFDGKLDSAGNKQEAREDFSQVIKRILGKFRPNSRLLILNDEAHHCYLPKSSGRTTDNEESDENARAAVWFTGLVETAQRFKVGHVYDLSATPYFLKGSGYPAYSLFPWVVTDFGLIEAIESGLVKIPFLPESDNTQELSMPVLRNLYEHVKNDLPKKGRKKKKSEARIEGVRLAEEPPRLPSKVKAALDQFYNHYIRYYEGFRKHREERHDLFSAPPVFIIVCNNTSVSKEVYKFIAGYEETDYKGNLIRVVDGHYPMFSNYNPDTRKPKPRSPTLLIDSDALENSEQVNDEFRKIFASELEEFKRDFARIYGQGSAERITDAEILREVVNTVGKQNKLGAHIRCVVSVSMLTEGWDANTVTHIMGLRAFGSQLLCEQVAGRALRRMNYYLRTYRKDTGEEVPEKDIHKYKEENLIRKYPPEYAHIIGVPFKMFRGGITQPPPPVDYRHIKALPERQEEFEITFPNIIGYRIEELEREIVHDFSNVEHFVLDFSDYPLRATLVSPISPHKEKMEVTSVLEKRDQELIFLITRALIRYHFSDDDSNPQFQLFGKLKQIVEEWYHHKVILINERDPRYKRLLYFEEPKKIADHIRRGINPHINTEEHIRPIFNHYNRSGSTRYVNGTTTKQVFPTSRSHVNLVVMDSEWEGICAKTLEEIPQVLSYAKNQFLGFAVPYQKDGTDRQYFPDFLARIKTRSGSVANLIIEITGMNTDKDEKKWFVENRWLPAVNAVREKYGMERWHFTEVAGDIRNIRNQLIDKITSIES
ncbi:MAG: DEAD/DEAH box helicase family protein [Bacteroidales bacterium]|nr:DEAD/DEAH box helicase family protein [Bacteroidales bacterium]